MASVDLSELPFRTTKPGLQDFGGMLTPPLGGAVQRVNRLGTRFRLGLTLPPVPEEPDGRRFAAMLQDATQKGALYPWPQHGLAIGSPGSPTVNGAVAGGTSVPIHGATPHYALRYGQFFSFVHSGQRYLHRAAAQAIFDASGVATVSVFPMLRVGLSNGDVVEIANPMIEGLFGSGDFDWDGMVEPFTQFSEFTISEAE